MEYLKTILYGIIEGITEWLPISSTGHLILAEKLLDMPYSDEFMSMFRVVIQLGAILAVVLLYFPKLWPFCTDPAKKFVKKDTWTLWFKILVATLPALVLGLLFDDWLDAHLYNYITVAVMLILYGVLFLVVENRRRTPTVTDLSQLSYKQALVIGFWQVLAMIPGTSRSGATIVGGLLLGASRPVVTEFTFFLAIPVMFGASLLKAVKYLAAGLTFTGGEVTALAVACVTAFFVSVAAIKFLVGFVKKHDFKPFGWYRIVLGTVVLAAALLGF
ncbi:undecaprenyl-diphosphatase [Oscillospiraceae bacterium]|nr:undecaprenyl-diphosphatase [Oscillospiraceae bacterium]